MRRLLPLEDDLELRLAIAAIVVLVLLWLGWPLLVSPASAQEFPGSTPPPAGLPLVVPPSTSGSSTDLPVVPLVERAEDGPGSHLDADERQWLEEVEWLITDEEKAAFLALEEPYRRRAFIDEFWAVRDTDPNTHMNELRLTWAERMRLARAKFGRVDGDRARFFVLNGDPIGRCLGKTKELEVWWYDGSLRTKHEFIVLFTSPGPKRGRPYEVYLPGGWFWPASRERLPTTRIRDLCSDEQELAARGMIDSQLMDDYEGMIERLMSVPEPPSLEWLSTFLSRSTLLPEGAETFETELSIHYPGRHQQRTVLQGMVTVPRDAFLAPRDSASMVSDREPPASGGQNFGAGIADADGGMPVAASDGSRPFLVFGEVIREGEIFDTFRYRFDPMVADPTGFGSSALGHGPIPLIFQRYLRPGPATLLLKVEDLVGRRFARLEQALEVPNVAEPAGLPGIESSELYSLLREAETATARGERKIRLLPPPGVVHTGLTRFSTIVVGDFRKATFFLDEQPILTKNRPPFSVELDLGDLPGVHRLRVAGLDDDGAEVAGDEIVLNPGGQSFRVRILEPRSDRRYEGSTRVVTDVQIPDGADFDRLELYLGEEPVATLYQEPFTQPLILPDGQLTYLRAVAHLADGHTSEDLVFVNAPGDFERVDVQFVELYTGVFDRQGRPIPGLGAEDFRVFEDDRLQSLRRFEWQRDLPIQVALLLDTSASMEERIVDSGAAAKRFVESILRPKDRAAVLAFDHQPRVERRFTNDLDSLASALETLRAEGGTALYDSLTFALHYFHGTKGQRALLLLSDGRDESSTFTLENTLEYVKRAGVKLYAIGIGDGIDRPQRKVLSGLSDITGGRAFFVDDTSGLDRVYADIEEELRSQYLLAYQSDSRRDPSEFRLVRVEIPGEKGRARKDVEIRTLSGYYP